MKLPNNLGAGELRSEEADVVGLEVGLPSRWEIVGLGLGMGLPNIWETVGLELGVGLPNIWEIVGPRLGVGLPDKREIGAQALDSDKDEKNHQSPG